MGHDGARRHGLDVDELPGQAPWADGWQSWAQAGEIDTFDQFVQDFWAGRVNADEFRRFRLQHGVYGQRQAEFQMVRVKIPWGGLTAVQLEALAGVAAETPRRVAHVTTRQNVQFHFVPLADATGTLRALAETGLTTREACGNTVRNVTVGQCAGVCPKEPFDPTPYADAVARFLLRNPMNQNLPRKFKIAFSGCTDDTGLTPIHDIGAQAAVEGTNGRAVRGFRVFLGGGLGSAPRLAQLLEPFTPAEDLLLTVAAIVRVFDRHGNRENRNMARLKYLVQSLGIDKLRSFVVRERDDLRFTMAGKLPVVEPWEERAPGPRGGPRLAPPDGPDYRRWVATSVLPQKQPGYVSVQVRLVLGDVTPEQLRTLARAAREFGDGSARSTNQQNLVVRWVAADALPALHRLLAPAGLALPGAERLIDVTSCPGADTCQLGITSSRGLAQAIAQAVEAEVPDLADEPGLRIKISGCPNSCGQHHLAGIGLFGGAKKFHGEQAPTYQMLLGATLEPGRTRYGRPVAKVPAKLVPAAVTALLRAFRDERQEGEPFDHYVDRVGLETLKTRLAAFGELPPPAEAPDGFTDWGGDGRFTVATGPGECAA